ncbi:MAG: DUF4926 domain-containing protein [Pyrinomonadaceae bacterium]|nr:DUF4926 domain-containing protein [Pyrinomonadaceae bacterium]
MLVKTDKRKAHEGDVVELLEDYPKYNLAKGQRGIVITEFDEPAEAYDLEIEDKNGDFLGFAYSVKPEHLVNLSGGAIERGLKHLETGDVSAAMNEFEYAIELRPGLIEPIHNLLVSGFASVENWEGAVSCLHLLLEPNPAYEQVRDSLAIAYLNWGVQVAKQDNIDHAFFLFLRASGITSQTEINERIRANFAASYYKLGVQAFRTGDFQMTRHLMRIACSYYPSAAVRKNLAVACIREAHFCMANNKFEEAIDAFVEAETVGLVSPDFINDYAISLVFVGRLDDARRAFERALALSPNDAIIEANLNRLLHQEAAESFVKEEKRYDFVPVELVAQHMQNTATV